MQTPAKFMKLATAAVLAVASLPALAVSSGPTSTVVYTGGNDLVLKASDGTVLNYVVPAGYKFTAGARMLTLAELTPGAKLTAPVATGSDPAVVSAIAVVKAKVYAITPPEGLTLIMSDGSKDFLVPAGTMFTVAGKPTELKALKADTMVDVTVITPAAPDAEPAPAPATPPMTGALIVAKTDDLPLAGTHLPLYGVVGFALLLMGFAMMRFRKPAHQM